MTEGDLYPGAVFRAATHPATITPTIRNVVVVWVGPLDVHYRYEDSVEIKATPVARFIEVVGAEWCFRSCPVRKQWDCTNKCATLRAQIIQLQEKSCK